MVLDFLHGYIKVRPRANVKRLSDDIRRLIDADNVQITSYNEDPHYLYLDCTNVTSNDKCKKLIRLLQKHCVSYFLDAKKPNCDPITNWKCMF